MQVWIEHPIGLGGKQEGISAVQGSLTQAACLKWSLPSEERSTGLVSVIVRPARSVSRCCSAAAVPQYTLRPSTALCVSLVGPLCPLAEPSARLWLGRTRSGGLADNPAEEASTQPLLRS